MLHGAKFKPDSYYIRKRPYITGWGRTAFSKCLHTQPLLVRRANVERFYEESCNFADGSLSARLQESDLPIVNNTECAQTYAHRKMARIDETVLCAGRGGKDSCQGDSGGPLMLPNAQLQAFFLAGIVSYGIRCADNYPGELSRGFRFYKRSTVC